MLFFGSAQLLQHDAVITLFAPSLKVNLNSFSSTDVGASCRDDLENAAKLHVTLQLGWRKMMRALFGRMPRR